MKNTNDLSDIDITILSDHTNIQISKRWEDKNLRIILNITRMPDIWGYLSGDWNFCILNAFKNYKNPNNVDRCVSAQNVLFGKKIGACRLEKIKNMILFPDLQATST